MRARRRRWGISQGEIAENAVRRLEFADLLDQKDERLPRVGERECLFGDPAACFQAVCGGGGDQCVAGGETVVEGADRDARAGGDVFERGVEAAFFEDRAGCRHERGAVAFGVAAQRLVLGHPLILQIWWSKYLEHRFNLVLRSA